MPSVRALFSWSPRHARKPTLVALALAGAVVGCQDTDNQNVPNRVLDRPLDLALACVEVATCGPEDGCTGLRGLPRTIAECGVRQFSSSCANEGTPQLVGFVANSEKNEVAMFTECSGALVDMDRETPGYQFIPVGTLPSSMTTSVDGCRVVTSNAGSCDLSVLDAPSLATYGLGPSTTTADEPSRFVSRLRPQRFDPDLNWVPVASRVGEVLAVRSELTGSRAVEGDVGVPGTCAPGDPGSVYLTFPTCDMVAEVDLLTQRILQSFQFVPLGDGSFDVVDTGASPVCPVDCPDQFSEPRFGGQLPPSVALAVAPELRPSALEFVGQVLDRESPAYFPSDDAIEDDTLFVGGIGADLLFEIRMDEDGRWLPEVNQLSMQRAGGIERIRATPTMTFTEGGAPGDYQFLYLIAGDGSTRVISREFGSNRAAIGIECETNPDPFTIDSAFGASPCVPVTPTPDGVSPGDRAPTAVGPGIRPRTGGRITDWFFSRVPRFPEGEAPILDSQGIEGEVTGLGATSQGALLGVKFQQYVGMPSGPPGAVDGAGLISHQLPPHTLDPLDLPANRLVSDTTSASFSSVIDATNVVALPQVVNAPPGRSIAAGSDPLRALAPMFRRIDWAYSAVNPANTAGLGPEGEETRASLLGDVANVDRLGANLLLSAGAPQGVGALHDEPVVRIAPRDYLRLPPGPWELQWEPTIPGTTSATGVIACDTPSWPPGAEGLDAAFCRPQAPGDARLVDEAAAFCDEGVLAGDTLLLVGCESDEGCGEGRACLQATDAGGESTGVCVAAQLVATRSEEERMRRLCAEFITDPCGEAFREYEVLRATQTELWIGPRERPEAVFLRGADLERPDDLGEGLVEEVGQFVCTENQPDGGCVVHADCEAAVGEGEPIAEGERAWCVDGRCQRRCNRTFEECLLRQVPAAACFPELATYQVRTHNSFVLTGPGSADFYADRVIENQAGECQLAGPADPISPLLSSRIPLGRTDDSLGLAPCSPSNSAVINPGDPNPCLITTPRGDGTAPYHTMAYAGETVSAVRFTNPFFTVVIDLVDLDSLLREVPRAPGTLWPVDFARFQRARIPRGYRARFETLPGYASAEDPNPSVRQGLSSTALVFPVRLVGRSPFVATEQFRFAFVIDAAGTGTSGGLRGQVMRVAFGKPFTEVDQAFDAVR